MSKLKFYHITRKENMESILKNGLVPSIGANRLRCRRRDERESKDARVSLCSFEEIEKWKDNIYIERLIGKTSLCSSVSVRGVICELSIGVTVMSTAVGM